MKTTAILNSYFLVGIISFLSVTFSKNSIAGASTVMTAPANGSVLSGSVLVRASVNSTKPISSVTFYRDNYIPLGTVSVFPYQLTTDTTLMGNGGHKIFAVTRITSGKSSSSPQLTVEVQNTVTVSPPAITTDPLTLSLTAPLQGATISGSSVVLSAAVTSNTGVNGVTFFRDDWIQMGTAAAAPFAISFDSTTLANGGHTFFATATTAAGATSASSVTSVQIQNSITSPPVLAPSACQPGVSPVGFDPLILFKKSYISGGKYAGAYLVGPGGYLNWYFSSLGVLGFIDRVPASEIKIYLNSYMANLERPTSNTLGYNIQDVTFADPYNPSASVAAKKPQDSDDSYAATILSVATRYVQCSGDRAWLNEVSAFGTGESNLQVLKKIAYYNLILPSRSTSTGLVHTFQNLAKYAIYYTEDNTEAYKGINDFAKLLSSIGDTEASAHAQVAMGIANGISNNLFVTNQNVTDLGTGSAITVSGFNVNWQGPITNNFYPGAVTQLFPVALGVPMSLAKNAAALATLNAMAPGWCNRLYDTQGKDPFMILGYGAAVLGERALAQCQLDYFAQLAQSNGATITVTGLGYYQRTLNVLAGQAPY